MPAARFRTRCSDSGGDGLTQAGFLRGGSMNVYTGRSGSGCDLPEPLRPRAAMRCGRPRAGRDGGGRLCQRW